MCGLSFLARDSRRGEIVIYFSLVVPGWRAANVPAGLAVVSLVACAFFTAFTGASGVTIIALGAILFPAMQQAGYPERFNLGLVTSAGSLGL